MRGGAAPGRGSGRANGGRPQPDGGETDSKTMACPSEATGHAMTSDTTRVSRRKHPSEPNCGAAFKRAAPHLARRSLQLGLPGLAYRLRLDL